MKQIQTFTPLIMKGVTSWFAVNENKDVVLMNTEDRMRREKAIHPSPLLLIDMEI